VPSKTLIRAAEVHHRAVHHGFDGVRTSAQPPDVQKVMAQKDALVTSMRQEKYEDVIRAYPNVTLRRSRGAIHGDLSVTVDGETWKPGRLIVTTGARPWAPPIAGLTESGSLTSTEALALTALPDSMIVIGGSAVGLEIAQLYARLGTRITVLEALPTLVPAEDADLGRNLADYLREEGLEVRTGATIGRVSRSDGRCTVKVTTDGRAGITGVLDYQACDEKVCFTPQSVPLSWRVTLRQLDRERVKQ